MERNRTGMRQPDADPSGQSFSNLSSGKALLSSTTHSQGSPCSVLSTDGLTSSSAHHRRARNNRQYPPRMPSSRTKILGWMKAREILLAVGLCWVFFFLNELVLFDDTHNADSKCSLIATKQKRKLVADFVQGPTTKFVLVDPYTPALLEPHELLNRTRSRTMLHLIKSRFMQYQPNLADLGWARLELFVEFCLPSMLKQTQQDFIWLIYTDPDLEQGLLEAMAKELHPYPNFYLIKSLSSAIWRGGQAVNLTKASFYSGDKAAIEKAIALRNTVPILETRLDADDAIHAGYLEEIQRQAREFFVGGSVTWMYWCVGRELAWHWLGPRAYSIDQKQYGILESKDYTDFCPTPGLTLGYGANTTVESIYTRRHSVLVQQLLTKTYEFCGPGREGKDCYQMVTKFQYPAFRSRTPTSASMVMTDFFKKDRMKKMAKVVDPKWEILSRDYYGLPRQNFRRVNSYFDNHIVEIAKDALLGQCTKGHSCREAALKSLEAVLEKYSNITALPA